MGWLSKICEKGEESMEGLVRRRGKNGAYGMGEQDW